MLILFGVVALYKWQWLQLFSFSRFQMVHAGDALGLHEAVVQRAKELFAGFRDDREMVQQFKGVIAAC